MPGRLIAKLREARGISQEDMALQLHMSQANYSKLENNKIELTAGLARRITKILNCTLDDIIPEEPAPAHLTQQKEPAAVTDPAVARVDMVIKSHIEDLKLWLEERLQQLK